MYIVLEGINGAGKTTIADQIEEQRGIESICYPVRHGTLGMINKILLGENAEYFSLATSFLNFYAMATDLNELDFNYDVLQVRGAMSSIVYGMSSEATTAIFGEDKLLRLLYEIATELLPQPDYIFYLDVPPLIAYERLQRRRGAKIPYHTLEKLEKAHTLFKRVIDGFIFDSRIVCIDATQPVDVILDQIFKYTDKLWHGFGEFSGEEE